MLVVQISNWQGSPWLVTVDNPILTIKRANRISQSHSQIKIRGSKSVYLWVLDYDTHICRQLRNEQLNLSLIFYNHSLLVLFCCDLSNCS